MKELNKLTSRNQFIAHYTRELQKEFNLKNLKLSKIGFMGFLLNLFGNMQYDIKYYYDYLFNESFALTARNNENLLLHSKLFGYTPNLSIPASIDGDFLINLKGMDVLSDNVYKREIYISNIIIRVQNFYFTSYVDYMITVEKNGNSGNVVYIKTRDKNNRTKFYNLKSGNMKVPILDMIQVKEVEYTYVSQRYFYASFDSFEIDLNGLYLADISATVNGKQFNVEFNKDLILQSNDTIFASFISNSKLIIELGSGEKGKYIPNSTIKIKTKLTNGTSGNIAGGKFNIFSKSLSIIDYDIYNNKQNVSDTVLNFNTFFTAEINKAKNGKDPEIGSNLRNALLTYIQTRDNLITEVDFDNILSKYFYYYNIFFKKFSSLNIINCYIPLLNRNTFPLKTTNLYIKKSEFEANMINNYIFDSTFLIDNLKFKSFFVYEYDQLLDYYKSYLELKEKIFLSSFVENVSQINFSQPYFAISLSYNYIDKNTEIIVKSFEDSSKYKIYLTSEILQVSGFIENTSDKLIKVFKYPGMILNPKTDITLDIYDVEDNYLYRLIYNNVYNLLDVSDIFSLKKNYDPISKEEYVVGVPVVEKDEFENDLYYYINNMFNILVDLKFKETRLVTDEIKLKFLETYKLDKQVGQNITVQKYKFNIYLPLKLKILIKYENAYVLSNNIDIVSEIDKFKLEVQKHLNTVYTGITIKFYKSKLIDFIHNFSWVKAAYVELYDFYESRIQNFENKDDLEIYEKDEIQEILPKLEILKYNPNLFYWDLDNIEFDFQIS